MTNRTFSRPIASPPATHRAACVCGRGFSIVEISIVLLIISIVSGLAILRFSSAATTYRIELAAKRITQDLQLARSRARATTRSQTVVFLDRPDAYRIVGERALRPDELDYRVTLSEDPFNVSIVSAVATDGGKSVVFDGWGDPQQGFELVIGAGSQRRTITVKFPNGAVTVTNP